MIDQAPELQLLYETAPVGLAFLSPDCRYLQINRHLTEICGISVADHIGRSVRDTVPQVADQVEHVVQTILRTGEPIIGIEVSGQRPDGGNAERVWLTYWHPLKDTPPVKFSASMSSPRKLRNVSGPKRRSQKAKLDFASLGCAACRPLTEFE
jgi:PAS domain S-box-containing protein